MAINSDASVKRLKGSSRPLQDEQSRAYVVGALSAVDLVVVFDEDTPAETIAALKPDVLVKGADWAMEQVVGADTVRAAGGRVLLVPLVRGHSTTSLVNRAIELGRELGGQKRPRPRMIKAAAGPRQTRARYRFSNAKVATFVSQSGAA